LAKYDICGPAYSTEFITVYSVSKCFDMPCILQNKRIHIHVIPS